MQSSVTNDRLSEQCAEFTDARFTERLRSDVSRLPISRDCVRERRERFEECWCDPRRSELPGRPAVTGVTLCR